MSGLRSLPELLAGLLEEGAAPPELAVSGLACDSRRVAPGTLFFAIPGTREDGARFAGKAVEAGAAAIVAARPLALPVPCLVARSPRRAAAIAAARFHGEPGRGLACVGVTGTNGKTTTCHLLAGLMQCAGRPFGLIGTVGHRAGQLALPAATTTPGPIELQELLCAMAEGKLAGCAMEVSSHALDQDRAAGVSFRVGVFTNLTRDHLDYHGSMEAYAGAKRRLFSGLEPGASAVANLDDPAGAAMLAAVPPGVERIGFSAGAQGGAVLRARALRPHPEGVSFRLEGPGGAEAVELPLVGAFNVENALAAAGAALALGLTLAQVAAGLARAEGAPGRLEKIPGPPGRPRVFVDYAHTPDALERALRALRPLTPGRLVVLFGCGGDRDRGKRPLMGRAAAAAADEVWVTSDNPRGEEPAAIIAAVLAGAGEGPARVRVEPDRETAIRLALEQAGPEDTVLVAGKGHESEQIVGERRLRFSDREVVGRLLCRG